MDENEKYLAELKASGVDTSEMEEAKVTEEEKPKEPEPKPSPALDKTEKPVEKEEEHLQTKQEEEQPQRKRSIYDDYKDKKLEAKTEKELREQVEKERDDLRTRVEALETAKTPEKKQEAQDKLEAFAQEIGADPDAIRKMRELFLEGVTPSNTDSISKEEFEQWKEWKVQNSSVIESSLFDKEFQSTVPEIKELFPKVSDDNLDAIKKELDVLSHTKEYHDKPLSYVAFMNREKLSTLVTPKKRGMEPKGNAHEEVISTDWNPDADLSKMTGKERDAWEKTYREGVKSNELVTGSDGKKLII